MGYVYFSLINNGKIETGKSAVFKHPFYNKSLYVEVNEETIQYFTDKIFTSPITKHKFGFDGEKFLFKSVDKEFRVDSFVEVENMKFYYDLIKYDSVSSFREIKNEHTEERILNVIQNANLTANVFIFSTSDIITHEDSLSELPKICYIKG